MNKEILKILQQINTPVSIIEGIKQLIDYEYLKIETDDKELLRFYFNKDLADDFLFAELIDTVNENNYYTVKLMYETMSKYNYVYTYAKDIMRYFKNNSFDVNNYEHRRDVVCHVLTCINTYKYSKIASINEIIEPVPIPIFLDLLNNDNTINKRVYIDTEYGPIAGELDSIIEQEDIFQTYYVAFIPIISKIGNGYTKQDFRIQVYPKSPLIKSLKDFDIHLIDDEMYDKLTKRGEKYIEVTSKPKYCYYSGTSYTYSVFGDNTKNMTESRVMIDNSAFNYFNLSIDPKFTDNIFSEARSKSYMKEVDPKDYWICSPVVYGFDFSNKQWYKFLIDNVSEITYSNNAFNELIIDDEIKNLFIAFVTHDIPSLDSIEGKGNGKIFLLYGPPGVGKTYSAEAVAEVLKKPLYYLSVGELGVTPKELEMSLEKAMKTVERWNAILLLDEVDVFAINRENSSIEQNAMTAILLRTLERYNGIMFMTTNLIDNLDPAFISRATAVIKYETLSSLTMFKIWSNLIDKIKQLNTINISSTLKEDIKRLYDKHAFLIYLNGRTIKNVLRLAYALALENKEELSIKQIEIAVSGLAKRGAY